MDCLEDADIVDLIEGAPSAARREEIQAHIDGCDGCRRLLAQVMLSRTQTGTSGGAPADLPLRPGERIGRYEITGVAGAGAMGVVYAARDPELDRNVAIKVLKGDAGDRPDEQDRLKREGQAMARLSHPNVLAVHDVGTTGGRLFVTMELIEGESLAEWLAQERRGWREIVTAFLAAGRGLAAAHGAGVLHRDFKPANVLRERAGRVVVGDFGLARIAGVASRELAGTPRYMAPEVLAGEPPTAASDQFGFCVALYEALYRKHPFLGPAAAGTAPTEPASSVDREIDRLLEAELAPAPSDADVPGRIRRVVVKGLSRNPVERWPSMDALLAALAADPGERIRRVGIMIGLVAVTGVGVALITKSEDRPEVCPADPAALAGVWDADARAAVERAFAATGRPFAAGAWAGVARGLDRWAADYAAMRKESCEATHVRRTQSADLLDRRQRCLLRRRVEAGALIELLREADAKTVERSVAAVQGLAPVADCADPAVFAAPIQPPSREQEMAVGTARTELARVASLGVLGKNAAALDVASKVLADALALGYLPLVAEARLEVGRMELRTNKHAEAEVSLGEALLESLASGSDVLAARASLERAWLLSVARRLDEMKKELRQADALLTRVGRPPRYLLNYHNARGQLADKEGRLDDAEVEFRLAADAARAIDDRARAVFLTLPVRLNLANNLARRGRLDEAMAELNTVLQTRLELLGEMHPDVGSVLNSMAAAYLESFYFDKALEHLDRARRVYEAVDPNDSNLPLVLANTGIALTGLGRYDEAVAYFDRAQPLLDARSKDSALAAENRAESVIPLIAAGKLDEAGRRLELSLATYEKALGLDHYEVARLRQINGDLLAARGRTAEALAEYERGLAIAEKTRTADSTGLIPLLTGVGAMRLAGGNAKGAIDPLRRAVALSAQANPAHAADAAFALARALHAARDPGGEVPALLAQARAAYEKAGPAGAKALAALAAWEKGRAK